MVRELSAPENELRGLLRPLPDTELSIFEQKGGKVFVWDFEAGKMIWVDASKASEL